MLGDEINGFVEVDGNIERLVIYRRDIHVVIDNVLLMFQLVTLGAAQHGLNVVFCVLGGVLRRVAGL